jgi:sulfofructose kinase
MPSPTSDPPIEFDVLGIGCTAVDERLFISEFPSADAKVRVLRRERSLGGLTAIALVAAARMGARVAFAGLLGPDELSQFVERSLQNCGITTDHVVRHNDARPGRSTILIAESSGTRAVLSERLGLRGADETRPEEELVRRSRVLYVDGHGLLGSIRAAKIARGSGRCVVADIERTHEGAFEQLLHLVDHLIVPETFAAAFTSFTDPASAAASLLTSSRSAVVVTCGRDGGVYHETGGSSMRYSAHRVRERDTTGCGDVFHGVYAAGLALGWDTATRIRYAAAAAALKATGNGGTDAIPDRDHIEAFLRG